MQFLRLFLFFWFFFWFQFQSIFFFSFFFLFFLSFSYSVVGSLGSLDFVGSSAKSPDFEIAFFKAFLCCFETDSSEILIDLGGFFIYLWNFFFFQINLGFVEMKNEKNLKNS